MNALLTRLFRHKAWSNAMLLKTFAEVGADHPATPLAIKALSHSHVVDRIFTAHLRGERHGYESANVEQLPTLQALADDIGASDRDLIACVGTLDAAQLAGQVRFTFTDGASGCMSREEMLMHLLTHGAGHRGQVSALMLLYGIEVTPSGFTTWLHEAEAAERGRTAPAASSVYT